MKKEILIILILVALILFWFAETAGMHKTSRFLNRTADLGFALLK